MEHDDHGYEQAAYRKAAEALRAEAPGLLGSDLELAIHLIRAAEWLESRT